MNISPEPTNNLYYTHDHEWVNFQETVAFVGVCAFKMTGIRQIKNVEFERGSDLKKAGDLLATVFSGEYKIYVHMPVDGEVINYNEELSGDQRNILLLQGEQSGWVALVVPSSAKGREDLLLPEEYLAINKLLL